MKKLAALAGAAALFTLLGAAPAAAWEDGAYLAPTNTYYLNPDTGQTDDGGSRNAALGEGMCRSAVYEQALVELEGGRIYVTARLRLARHMRDIRLWVRGGDGVYAPAQTQVMMEDAAADTADYRFALPAVDTYVSWEMYVIPMGREVKFYMNLAPDLTPGGGDFVVSVKPEPPAAESRQGEGAAEPDEPDESAEPEDWAVPATAGPEPSLAELAPEADEPAPPAEAGTEAAALEPPADPETEPPAETAPPAAGSMPAEEGSPPESGGGKNEAAGASPALIVPAVLAAAALSAALSMKRRRKTPR